MTPDQVEALKLARDSAWASFNFKAMPSKNNPGWPAFALANCAWERAYLACYGKEPEPDTITKLSSSYHHWYSHKSASEKAVPDRVWKI